MGLLYDQVYIQLLRHPENPKRVSLAAAVTVKQKKKKKKKSEVKPTLETGRWERGS